jgi:hypothetical protein
MKGASQMGISEYENPEGEHLFQGRLSERLIKRYLMAFST